MCWGRSVLTTSRRPPSLERWRHRLCFPFSITSFFRHERSIIISGKPLIVFSFGAGIWKVPIVPKKKKNYFYSEFNAKSCYLIKILSFIGFFFFLLEMYFQDFGFQFILISKFQKILFCLLFYFILFLFSINRSVVYFWVDYKFSLPTSGVSRTFICLFLHNHNYSNLWVWDSYRLWLPTRQYLYFHRFFLRHLR